MAFVYPMIGLSVSLHVEFAAPSKEFFEELVFAFNEMGVRMFGMPANAPLTQQFAGYALVVPFLLQIVTGLLPDFTH